MEIEELSAQNDHLQKSALILVVRVFSPVVEVISVDYEQVQAEEVKAVVLVFFVEVREHLQQRTLAAQHIMIIYRQGSKSSTHSCESGTDDT